MLFFPLSRRFGYVSPTNNRCGTAYAAKIAQFEREVAAYDAMWPELLKTHKDKWVAIHQGQLVDQDDDERVLRARIDARFGPEKWVYIQQVLQTRREVVDIPGIDLD